MAQSAVGTQEWVAEELEPEAIELKTPVLLIEEDIAGVIMEIILKGYIIAINQKQKHCNPTLEQCQQHQLDPTMEMEAKWGSIPTETAALAQKNSEAARALAVQSDILEKELGEIQQVLLAMQEQQRKQLDLILAIGKAGEKGLLESQDKLRSENLLNSVQFCGKSSGTLGSIPPSCHNKCNDCHPCMAVQVPTLPSHDSNPPDLTKTAATASFLDPSLQGNRSSRGNCTSGRYGHDNGKSGQDDHKSSCDSCTSGCGARGCFAYEGEEVQDTLLLFSPSLTRRLKMHFNEELSKPPKCKGGTNGIEAWPKV
ncbi:EPIDERMAL PATTERNING FACTOR protein 1 [Spatholobus suberectus]|nr:EPIDERMAL PATTERNING FACTOR protein 1 [Spatholobus suberectus]